MEPRSPVMFPGSRNRYKVDLSIKLDADYKIHFSLTIGYGTSNYLGEFHYFEDKPALKLNGSYNYDEAFNLIEEKLKQTLLPNIPTTKAQLDMFIDCPSYQKPIHETMDFCSVNAVIEKFNFWKTQIIMNDIPRSIYNLY